MQNLKGRSRKPTMKGHVSNGFVKYMAGALSSKVSVPTGYYAVACRFVNIATGQERRSRW